ncbi:MAG: SDR family oxidoreductase [Azospirillaceae bacterium]
MQSFDFTGQTALVTGAASGIGRATVELLAVAGARVVAADINQGAVACLAAELADCGLAVEPAVLDVAEPDAWTRLFAGPAAAADLFVLNAGIAHAGDLAGTTLADWREVFAVNCDGVFLGLSHAFASLRRAGRPGRVVVTGSAAARKAQPAAIAYAASKAALESLVRSAAKDGAADGIAVNLVAPGGVKTAIWDSPGFAAMAAEMGGRESAFAAMARAETPLGRFAEAEEVAAAIGFLLSPASAFMTGATLLQDGGYTL